jgi:hypothetical protein
VNDFSSNVRCCALIFFTTRYISTEKLWRTWAYVVVRRH